MTLRKYDAWTYDEIRRFHVLSYRQFLYGGRKQFVAVASKVNKQRKLVQDFH